jgi:hypothetical protein
MGAAPGGVGGGTSRDDARTQEVLSIHVLSMHVAQEYPYFNRTCVDACVIMCMFRADGVETESSAEGATYEGVSTTEEEASGWSRA